MMNNTVKKIVTVSLACAFIVSGMTACGSKSNKTEYEDTSRVLYTDEDTQTEETDSSEESSDASKNESGKNESGKNESGKSESGKNESGKTESKKDSSKTESKKSSSKTESKAAASKAASSKTTTSSRKSTAATTGRTSTNNTTAAASSSAASSKSDTSSKENTDTASDSDKLSDTDTETDTDTDTENTSDTETETDTDTETETDTETDTEIEGSAPFDEDVDLVLTYSGYVIKLGADMEDVLDNLGEATVVEDSAGGTVKSYYYNTDGFEIRAYTDDFEITDESKFYVFSIKMDTAGYYVATDKNIAIGDTKQDMLSIYGSDYVDTGDGYRFDSSDGKSSLTFVFNEDIISEIIYSLDVTA